MKSVDVDLDLTQENVRDFRLNNFYLFQVQTGFTSFQPPSEPYTVNTTRSYLREIGEVAIREVALHVRTSVYNRKIASLFDALVQAGSGSGEMSLFTKLHQVRKDMIIVAISFQGEGHKVQGHKGEVQSQAPDISLVALQIDAIDLSDAKLLLSRAKQFEYKVAFLDGELNESVFDKVKKTIEDKLGDRLKSEVFPIGQ